MWVSIERLVLHCTLLITDNKLDSEVTKVLEKLMIKSVLLKHLISDCIKMDYTENANNKCSLDGKCRSPHTLTCQI